MYMLNKVINSPVAIGICICIFLHSEIYAQSNTTIIGGGGLPEMEINLDSIDLNNRLNRNLKYPGQKIDTKVKLVWPKNLEETKIQDLQEKTIKAPIQKVYEKKLLAAKSPAKIIKKKSNYSKNTLNTQREKNTDSNNRILKPRTKKITNKKISSLKPQLTTTENKSFLRVIFKPSQTKIDKKYNLEISKFTLSSIKQNSRFEIRAYASASGNRPTYARRVSLSRALAIRSELIENGVNSSNIDVRALGEPKDGDISDRVDVSIMPQ